MDKKQGKYVVNIEHSENQPSVTCPNDQEAHSFTSWCPPSNETMHDVSSNLTGACMSPGVFEHSRCAQPESSNTQFKGNCCNEWSLWKVFLACLLACVITTVIGVLIICLVNNKGDDYSYIVIQLPPNNTGKTCTTSQTAMTSSVEPATTTTSTSTPTKSAPTTTATQSITTRPIYRA
ncbi:dynactin-associated protein [Nycticebus coucang]|uniref:dynactin-associated protein n=1 Tax=Nycticebus coucang TaxID=9470 RepID=UPI00234E1AB2|nr:dynactin-associated protein [Nycticebus coucang]